MRAEIGQTIASRIWCAGIKKDYQHHHLGYFDRLEDAAAARKAAEERMGFHPNHGRARA
jgi:hypothetical protein